MPVMTRKSGGLGKFQNFWQNNKLLLDLHVYVVYPGGGYWVGPNADIVNEEAGSYLYVPKDFLEAMVLMTSHARLSNQ